MIYIYKEKKGNGVVISMKRLSSFKLHTQRGLKNYKSVGVFFNGNGLYTVPVVLNAQHGFYFNGARITG